MADIDIDDAELAAEELEDLGFVTGYEGQLCQLCGRPHGGETAYMTAEQLLQPRPIVARRGGPARKPRRQT